MILAIPPASVFQMLRLVMSDHAWQDLVLALGQSVWWVEFCHIRHQITVVRLFFKTEIKAR